MGTSHEEIRLADVPLVEEAGSPQSDEDYRPMSTLQTVQKLIASALDLDPETLDPVRPLEELGIDSLTVMECLFKIEDEFKISIANSDLAVRTLQDIADMVDSLLAAKVAEVS